MANEYFIKIVEFWKPHVINGDVFLWLILLLIGLSIGFAIAKLLLSLAKDNKKKKKIEENNIESQRWAKIIN